MTQLPHPIFNKDSDRIAELEGWRLEALLAEVKALAAQDDKPYGVILAEIRKALGSDDE